MTTHNGQLHHFHGGLHLPEHKSESTGKPIRDAAIPERLALPLKQHIGAPAHLLVKPGERVLKGQMLAASSGRISAPVHAPTSGTVIEISEQQIPHPSGLSAPCIIIETDGKDEWGELPAPMTNWKELDAGTLIDRIRDCGIVGLGGATCPSSVKLEQELADGLPEVRGNANQLQQVINNFAINAQQALGEDGGNLTVRTHTGDGDSIVIEVEDDGPGIPEDIRGNIFDPFFTTKPAGHGTGLGLSVTYGIVRDHGGDIRIEDPPGGGTRFVVTLPIESSEVA